KIDQGSPVWNQPRARAAYLPRLAEAAQEPGRRPRRFDDTNRLAMPTRRRRWLPRHRPTVWLVTLGGCSNLRPSPSSHALALSSEKRVYTPFYPKLPSTSSRVGLKRSGGDVRAGEFSYRHGTQQRPQLHCAAAAESRLETGLRFGPTFGGILQA